MISETLDPIVLCADMVIRCIGSYKMTICNNVYVCASMSTHSFFFFYVLVE